MKIRIGIVLAVATTAWLTGPLTTAAPAAPDRGVAPTKIRVVPAKVLENQPAGTLVGRIVVRDRDRGDRHTLELVRGKRFFEVVGHSLVTTRALDHEKRPKLRIRLRATDAAGHRFARTLRVRVADVDDPPTAVDDTLTVLEDGGPQLLDVLDNDTDSDYEGGPRHIASVTQPEHGVVALFGRATVLTYDPDPDYCNETTTDDFTYTIVYGGSTGTVGVTVECVQDAPVAVDDARTTPEDTPLVLPATGPGSPVENDTDADGDALTVSAVSGAGGGSVVLTAGEITFTPDADRCGPAAGSFDYTVSDGHGGADTGTVSVTITCVGEGPSIAPDSATVTEDAAATAIDVLANDTPGRSITAVTQPPGGNVLITGGGTGLTYAPDPDFCTAGADDSFTYTVTGGLTATVGVTVTCVNDAPVADDESFSGANAAVGNTSLVVDDPTDAAPAPAGVEKAITGDLLAGDTDAEGAGALTIAPVTDQATTGGGRVTIEADGDFTYLPERGCGDTTDTFDYTLRDNDAADPLTDTGSVTIAIAGCVWYVDANASAPAAGIAGTSQAPYLDLAELDDGGGSGDEDATGEWLFLADGTYTVASHLLLENDQQLYTDRSGLAVGGATLLARDPARDRSTIVGGVTVGKDTTIQGLDLGAAVNYALTGNSVDSLTVNTETSGDIENPGGGAVSIGGTANVLDVEWESIETGTLGIDLFGASGSLVVNDGELTSTWATTVQLNQSPLDLTVDADITGDNIVVSISSSGSGTKDFNGHLSGERVYLLNNTAATIRFDGGLNLSSGTSAAFVAAGGGTLAVTDPAGAGNNTLDATSGAPLTVSDTTIHADDLTFERISSDGAVNGINLERTGSDGGLVVTGDSSDCLDRTDTCDGGVIANSTGPGIVATDVGGGISLARMRVTDSGDDGIRATRVTGLTLDKTLVTDNGDGTGEIGLDLAEVTGDVTIGGSKALDNHAGNLQLSNTSGTATVDIQYSAFDYSGGDGIRLVGGGTATMNVVATGIRMASNSSHGLALSTSAVGATPTVNLTLRNSSVEDPLDAQALGSVQLGIYPARASTTKVLIENTNLTEANGTALALQPGDLADLDVTIRNSIIQDPTYDGIVSSPSDASDLRLRIANVQVRRAGGVGIVLLHNGPAPGGFSPASYTVVSSTVEAGPLSAYGLLVSAGDDAADTVTVCADIGGAGALANQLHAAGGPAFDDVRIRSGAGSTLLLPNWSEFDLPGYLLARNSALTTYSVALSGTTESAPLFSCDQPVLPPA